MAIGTPVQIDDINKTGVSGTNSFNTVGAGGVPQLATIITAWVSGEAGSGHAASDSKANTYVTRASDADHAGDNQEFLVAQAANIATALVQNDTVDWDWTDAVLDRSMGSFYVTGLDGNEPTNATGGVVTPTEATGEDAPSFAAATPAGDWIAVGLMSNHKPASGAVVTEDTGWTTIDSLASTAGERGLHMSYQKGSGNAGVTWAPTFDTTTDLFIVVLVFSAAAAGGVSSRGIFASNIFGSVVR